MIALNIEILVPFVYPHLFEVSALRMLSVCFALMRVRFMHCKNFAVLDSLPGIGYY